MEKICYGEIILIQEWFFDLFDGIVWVIYKVMVVRFEECYDFIKILKNILEKLGGVVCEGDVGFEYSVFELFENVLEFVS